MLGEKEKTLMNHSSTSSSSSSEGSSIASATPKKQPEKAKSDLSYLKLDIKFHLPTYNGEINAEL